jgi:Na+/H+ antiporter NhaC
MTFLRSLLILPLGLLLTANLRADDILPADETVQLEDSRYSIEVFGVVLTDVPVKKIVIQALDVSGEVDTSFNGQPLITGIRLSIREKIDVGSYRERSDAELPAFTNGVLELETDLAQGQKVYVIGPEIVVDPENRRSRTLEVTRTLRWFSLVPPMLAIVLAMWLRNVIVALFVAVWSGAVILSHGDFFNGFVRTLDTYLIGELVQVDRNGNADHSHMMIILFTMFLGAMIGVMARSGGTKALASSLARFTRKREHGQVMTWVLGLVIFFDDYANTLLVGSTMRPVTDRLRISREKLAFLVDSTAAPVAGLAMVSTWVGVEIGYISDTYADLGMSSDVYLTFLYSTFFRFYPLHLLVFVLLIAVSGRDFGPMLKAEARAMVSGQVIRPGAVGLHLEENEFVADDSIRPLYRNALVPLFTLLALIVVGLWWTGTDAVESANREALLNSQPVIETTLWSILSAAKPNRVMFLSSFVASLVAMAVAVFSRSLSPRDGMNAWSGGAKSMFFALLILVMAWGVATVCDQDHLNTAGFLVELTQGALSVNWMPTLAFLLAAGVSFATGSSYSTMGLLMPLFITTTYYLLSSLGEADPNHHLMLATIGAVLAGSIFGDHCSPISDTTVLSSAASGSDHLDHVSTQLPYAVSVALVALLLGYVPVGFGYSPVVLLPLGLIVLYLIVQFLGRPVEEYAKSMAPLDDLPSADASKADGTDTADGTNPEEKNAGEQSASDS